MMGCGFGIGIQVAERVRDAYRVAWGMPWMRTVIAATPNSMMAFTPLVSRVYEKLRPRSCGKRVV